MAKKRDMNQKARSDKGKNSSPPLNGRSALFSNDQTGTMGTKRQTYHIHIDLIAKLQGYAYWERRMISEMDLSFSKISAAIEYRWLSLIRQTL